MSKYILFPNSNRDYGTNLYSPVRIGMRLGGVGKFSDKDAEEYISKGAQEIDEREFDQLKKKATSGAGSYRPFNHQPNDPAKNPNADYVDTPVPSKEPEPEKVETLLEVEEVVEEVAEVEEVAVKPAKKGKKK